MLMQQSMRCRLLQSRESTRGSGWGGLRPAHPSTVLMSIGGTSGAGCALAPVPPLARRGRSPPSPPWGSAQGSSQGSPPSSPPMAFARANLLLSTGRVAGPPPASSPSPDPDPAPLPAPRSRSSRVRSSLARAETCARRTGRRGRSEIARSRAGDSPASGLSGGCAATAHAHVMARGPWLIHWRDSQMYDAEAMRGLSSTASRACADRSASQSTSATRERLACRRARCQLRSLSRGAKQAGGSWGDAPRRQSAPQPTSPASDCARRSSSSSSAAASRTCAQTARQWV
jgi:hypothetical protein